MDWTSYIAGLITTPALLVLVFHIACIEAAYDFAKEFPGRPLPQGHRWQARLGVWLAQRAKRKGEK